MKLILLRHGRTRANELRLYCGSSDVPLSEQGRAELEKLKARGIYPDLQGYLKISSGMLRTDETLRLICGAEPDVCMPELREMDFGRFEMHSYEEMKNDADYQAWICDESGMTPTPGGESSCGFRSRVRAAAETIRQDAVVVCHGGVIAALMAYWFPDEGKNMYQWQPEGGCGYLVEFLQDSRAWSSIADAD